MHNYKGESNPAASQRDTEIALAVLSPYADTIQNAAHRFICQDLPCSSVSPAWGAKALTAEEKCFEAKHSSCALS